MNKGVSRQVIWILVLCATLIPGLSLAGTAWEYGPKLLFDDLPFTTGISTLPFTTYGGFTFGGGTWRYIDEGYYALTYANTAPLFPSHPYALLAQESRTFTISSGSTFHFAGAYFGTWTSNGTTAGGTTQLQITGFRGSEMVGTVTLDLLPGLLTPGEANFLYVDRLEFTELANAGPGGWLMDYFVYVPANSTPVPIPAAVWLLGSGLIGIISVRWRFRKYKY